MIERHVARFVLGAKNMFINYCGFPPSLQQKMSLDS
jgi:hypothetical protein